MFVYNGVSTKTQLCYCIMYNYDIIQVSSGHKKVRRAGRGDFPNSRFV